MRKLLVITFGVFVLFVVGREIWYRYVFELDRPIERAVAEFKTSSTMARWWRCRGIQRPLLTDTKRAWQLHYSWEGGMGPGSVMMDLSSDGSVMISSKKHGQADWTEHPVRLSQAEIAELGSVVDETGLLCQSSRMRDGHTVFDLGRYTIQVGVGDSMHQLVVDSCRTIPDARALSELFAVLRKHKGLPEELEWGPYATFTAFGSCKSEVSNQPKHATRETRALEAIRRSPLWDDRLQRLGRPRPAVPAT